MENTNNVTSTPAPAAQPDPEVMEDFLIEANEEAEEKEEAPAPKLILNTQRILADWKHEKGKVLIFFMYLIKIFGILCSIGLFTTGFIFLIASKVAIGFWEPIREIPGITEIAPILLISATFVAIWCTFVHILTPYFKAFSIAKWLKNNKVDSAEVMKIYLQFRNEKKLTKYNKGKGGIKVEQSDLAQAAFLVLDEKHKSIYKQELLWTILFWVFISAAKILFVFGLSEILGALSLQVASIVNKEAAFTFMGLLETILTPVFLGSLGGWIFFSITNAIVRASIACARNKEQQKWVKAYMKDDLPSKEYY